MTAYGTESVKARPFPYARGRGLRIAVIDTGVNVRHPHIFARTTGNAIGESKGASWDDKLGHGTAVMAAIQEKAPAAKYTAVKLFEHCLRTTSDRLRQALLWTIDNHFDIVNLSLGTPNLECAQALQEIVNQAAAAGVILVSARRAGDRPVLPGSLPGVISVDVDWDLDRESYRIEEVDGEPRYFASGYPRPLPGMPQERNLNGISFAVANMAGFVACACEGRVDRDLKCVHEALAAELAQPARIPGSPAPSLQQCL